MCGNVALKRSTWKCHQKWRLEVAAGTGPVVASGWPLPDGFIERATTMALRLTVSIAVRLVVSG